MAFLVILDIADQALVDTAEVVYQASLAILAQECQVIAGSQEFQG